MICRACKANLHEHCPGGTWCCCQHYPPGSLIQQPLPSTKEPDRIEP